METSTGRSIDRVNGGSFWYVLLIGVELGTNDYWLGSHLAKLKLNEMCFFYLLTQVISNSACLMQQRDRLSE